MSKFKILSVFFALYFLSISSHAAIISGDLTTAAGSDVDLSGLEWLSFDHLASDGTDFSTIGLSYDTVSAADSIWSLDGWRYASTTEVNNLWLSLGLTGGAWLTNSDGVDFILGNWGGVDIPMGDFVAGTLTTTTGAHTKIEAMYGDASSGEVDSMFLRTDFELSNVRNGQVVSASSFLDEATRNQWMSTDYRVADFLASGDQRFYGASFLVREASDDGSTSVPEPGMFALFSLGLIGMGIFRRRIQK